MGVHSRATGTTAQDGPANWKGFLLPWLIATRLSAHRHLTAAAQVSGTCEGRGSQLPPARQQCKARVLAGVALTQHNRGKSHGPPTAAATQRRCMSTQPVLVLAAVLERKNAVDTAGWAKHFSRGTPLPLAWRQQAPSWQMALWVSLAHCPRASWHALSLASKVKSRYACGSARCDSAHRTAPVCLAASADFCELMFY